MPINQSDMYNVGLHNILQFTNNLKSEQWRKSIPNMVASSLAIEVLS